MQPRREVWEYGALPLQALCPQLDGVQSLMAFHAKLFARSKLGPNGQRTVSLADVGQVLELTTSQLDVLAEVLAALSYANSAAAPPPGPAAPAAPPPLGQEEVHLHELSLFLFCQLFSKEAQRADAVEYWPDASGFGAASMFSSGGGSGGGFAAGQELLSPTRRSQSGRGLLRQQLQGHIRAQVMALRAFGDYLRRNLRSALELCLDAPPPPAASASAPSSLAAPPASPAPASSSAAASAQQGQQQQQQPLVSARELDRLGFLVLAGPQGNRGEADTLSAALALAGPGGHSLSGGGGSGGFGFGGGAPGGARRAYAPLPLDAAASAVRALWAEEVGGGIDSPRLLAFSLASSAASPSPKFQRSMGMVAPAGQVDETAISGVYRGTVVRGEGDLPHGDVRITDCHEAVVYVLAPMQAVFVSGCSDCTIVIGAVGRLLRAERCDKVTLIAATNRLLIAACHDCTFHVGTPRPPCLIGDNRFLRLAPFNTRYERQAAHAREVGLRCDLPNRFDTPVLLVGKDRAAKGLAASASPNSPRHGGGGSGGGAAGASGPSAAAAAAAKASYSLLPPDELLPFIVPFVGGPGPLAGGSAPPQTSRWNALAASRAGPLYLFPLPPDYDKAMQRRLGLTHDMRNRFKQVGLTKDKERELNDAIQGYFKEWLVGSNLLRQIYDLSTLEKEEMAAQGLAPPPGMSPVSSSGGGGGGGGPAAVSLSPLPSGGALGGEARGGGA